MKHIWIFSLAPELLEQYFSTGVSARLHSKLQFHYISLRDFSTNAYRSVDDRAYGIGQGMVIRADVCLRALEQTIFPKLGITAEQWDKEKYAKQLQIMDFAPCGQVWSTAEAKDVATSVLGASGIEHVAIFCARYEGIDQRFIDLFVHRRYSLGDYVLTNGDLAAMVFLDSSARFLEGILGNPKSLEQDSFEDGLLDAPCYAKPREFLGQSVPNVLLEGHHQKILAYQLQQKEQLTKKCRPDLWERYKARQ